MYRMTLPRAPKLTAAELHGVATKLFDLRCRLDVIVSGQLNGSVPARIVDAALNADRRMRTLALRLADAASDVDSDAAAATYRLLELPTVAPPPRTLRGGRQRLGADEHRAIGPALKRLRDELMALAAYVQGADVPGCRSRYPKTSPLGRALAEPARATDRLRCRLDGLLYREHRHAFNTRVYFPGPGAAPPSPALEKGGVR